MTFFSSWRRSVVSDNSIAYLIGIHILIYLNILDHQLLKLDVLTMVGVGRKQYINWTGYHTKLDWILLIHHCFAITYTLIICSVGVKFVT